MLKLLEEYESLLPELLQNETNWNSLLVDYETPNVYRLWRQMDQHHRLMLHKIMPCDKPYTHNHPWPSAVHILEGAYEMQVGIDYVTQYHCDPMLAATMILAPGTKYEMLDPNSWHYVKPLNEPSYSVMVIGKPWPQNKMHKVQKPNPLSSMDKTELIQKFKALCNV